MSLIHCPECSNEVSNRAYICPRCGFPIEKNLDDEKEYAPNKVQNEEKDYGFRLRMIIIPIYTFLSAICILEVVIAVILLLQDSVNVLSKPILGTMIVSGIIGFLVLLIINAFVMAFSQMVTDIRKIRNTTKKLK